MRLNIVDGASARRYGRTTSRTSVVMGQYGRYGSAAHRSQPWQVVSAVCAVAMLLCNFHRSVFTALLPLIAGSLALTPSEVGLVQSSMLWGYLAGQIPAGRLADERGGDSSGHLLALAVLLAARVCVGVFSSVIMPSVSAATAQWVPAPRKAATLALIYAFFNVGGVLGLIVAPHLASRGAGGGGGWASAFVTAAAGGVLWALLGSAAVARAQGPALAAAAAAASTAADGEGGEACEAVLDSSGRRASADPWVTASDYGDDSITARQSRTLIQVAALCWCHVVIGWGFFVLQAWIPMYLQSLGVTDLANAGLLASLPWLAAAFTATAAGGLADGLVRSGRMKRLAVRRCMHAVSTLGCAVAVLPLAAAPGGSLPPAAATACLVAAVGCYGFSFGGFHAYIQASVTIVPQVLKSQILNSRPSPPPDTTLASTAQQAHDVAAADAGQLLGLTNTGSILGGIAGNLATGAVLQATGGYWAVFWIAAALYGTSWICFLCLLQGDPISLVDLTRTDRRPGAAKPQLAPH
ncbi:hypothetical protein VOLCADRAFT_92899 [Volvox carteri f. nagariensis]|uniref:Major facilitator superfamily (MFS) profile domain-containing protein n=1 Tax=Volvox carteri f. nagariensis TaxID=3068 RepID=D8U0R7_VOLCA|nr:uncharacterized protein VOLCADRAFT_92899 [Volvox carteri f. nagariensis]EFJ46763.1 hypothetical protein VOLCADRAFT_92899 [Volvox carteri f. nagariensis]|eukprot:XP_002952292.1 hypothetical protein VOLCADRAFT_92899 [Volvox carteri f. nagariensis]